MKKIYDKKILFGFLLGIIVTCGISVYAVDHLYISSNVSYKETNVESSLNDLYQIINKGDATSNDIFYGKKAIVGGKEITGIYHGYEIVEMGTLSRYFNYNTYIYITITFNNTYTDQDNVYFSLKNIGFASGSPYVDFGGADLNKVVGNSISFYVYNSAGSSAGSNTFTFDYELIKYR